MTSQELGTGCFMEPSLPLQKLQHQMNQSETIFGEVSTEDFDSPLAGKQRNLNEEENLEIPPLSRSTISGATNISADDEEPSNPLNKSNDKKSLVVSQESAMTIPTGAHQGPIEEDTSENTEELVVSLPSTNLLYS